MEVEKNQTEESAKSDSAENKVLSKEAQAILQLSQHQDEFFTTVFVSLASIEARINVNQNLLMTILGAQKGLSDEEINDIKTRNREDYKAGREAFSKIYAEKFKEYKAHFSKLYEESV